MDGKKIKNPQDTWIIFLNAHFEFHDIKLRPKLCKMLKQKPQLTQYGTSQHKDANKHVICSVETMHVLQAVLFHRPLFPLQSSFCFTCNMFYNAASVSWKISWDFGPDLCAETRHLIQSLKMKENSEDSCYSQVYPVVSVTWPCDICIQCSDGGSPVWGRRPRSWQREILWLLQTSLQQNGKQNNNLSG